MRHAIRHAAIVAAVAAMLVGVAGAEDVTFTFDPPSMWGVTTVSLRGSFNDWGETPMSADEEGIWSVTIDLPDGEHHYKYFVNGEWPQSMADHRGGGPMDPKADGYVQDGYGGMNAVRLVGDYDPEGKRKHVFTEEVVSESESIITMDPTAVVTGNHRQDVMRFFSDMMRLALDKGYTYIAREEVSSDQGTFSMRLQFFNDVPEGYVVVDPAGPGPGRDVPEEKMLVDAAEYLEFMESMRGPAPKGTQPKETGPAVGYRIEGDEVVFEFRAADYAGTTDHETGRWTDMAELSIDTVVVAGGFNDWSRDAWPMSQVSDGVYELRKDVSLFVGKEAWQFKFVVNGLRWVEPPGDASNRVTAGPDNTAQNLELRIE